MNAPSPDTVMVACSVVKAEIEALRRGRWPDLPVRYLSSMLHMRPRRLEERLRSAADREVRRGHRVVLVYGDCCAGMTDLSAQPQVARVACYNCCELLLGREEYRRLEHEGAFFLLPEWARRWREVFTRELGLSRDNARGLMGEMHRKLVYLDTGVVPAPLADLEACSAYVGLPWEVMAVSLAALERAVAVAVAAGNPEDREGRHGTG